MKRLQNTGNRIIPLVFFGALLGIWQMVVDFGVIERFILPSPADIVITLFKVLPELRRHLVVTLREAAIGFGISIVLSVLLAVVMDSIDMVYKALYPIFIVTQTIPTVALAPLFIIWFGFGELPKIIVVVLVCFFPIVVNLLDGLKSVDPDMLNLLKSMGAGRFQIFRLVKFPASLYSFFSGLRIAATYSIMGAVIGEWAGGERGLGVYMLIVKKSFAVDKFFAAILIVVALSMALFKLISVIQDLLMPWARVSSSTDVSNNT